MFELYICLLTNYLIFFGKRGKSFIGVKNSSVTGYKPSSRQNLSVSSAQTCRHIGQYFKEV